MRSRLVRFWALAHVTIVLSLGIVVASGGVARAGLGAPELTPDQARRVDELLSRMTLDEKVGQMMQLTLETVAAQTAMATRPFVLDEAKARSMIVDHHTGSMLNAAGVAMTPDQWRDIVGRLQQIATGETRLGVPLIYGIDSVHGANYVKGATIFPHNLTLAATFEPGLSRKAGYYTAAESRACGLAWNFAPVCGLARMPAWSRVFETFGEDPCLAGAMAAVSVEGQQGDDLSAATAVAATAKHFLGYSVPRTGRDRTPAYIPDTELMDTYLPPFEEAFAAGARTIMVNSSEINGVPVHASQRILTDLLRGRVGFEGLVVTDWADIQKLVNWHRVAENETEATRLAVDAGIDMAMTPLDTRFAGQLAGLVRSGAISESRIDESVRRILALKMELGLFEHPMPGEDETIEIGSDEAQMLSLEIARRGVTLLRNRENLLPLSGREKLLVTGPTADSVVPLHGAWTYSWQGTDTALYPDTPTVLDEIRHRFGDERVAYEPGASFDEAGDLDAVARAAADADVVILCLGAQPSAEKPGDIANLDISPAQQQLAEAIVETGKPVVLLLIENRPRIITAFEKGVDAVLWAGHPGPHGSRALAEIIAGDVNPSGRLPFSYPRDPQGLLTYDHKHSERFDAGGHGERGYDPLFAFGEGLSYTTFEYTGLEIDVPASFPETGKVAVRVRVRNTGARDGAEVVGLYLTDEVASITPRVRRLKAFDKIDLRAGEERTVSFDLGPDAFLMVDAGGRREFEPGAFAIQIGDQSQTFRIPAAD
ncbi:MAG: glycoside hydrolase family 3 C-terminal domain-containing protein [Phycisphaeraceae bacterium]|nr:MAG: glycoside hydrolase family 3 C-terminal domain-containing protein [Phycisphaeraceae bacterium]